MVQLWSKGVTFCMTEGERQLTEEEKKRLLDTAKQDAQATKERAKASAKKLEEERRARAAQKVVPVVEEGTTTVERRPQNEWLDYIGKRPEKGRTDYRVIGSTVKTGEDKKK